jgi:hypothetical protein
MSFLVMRAYAQLIMFDLYLKRQTFRALYDKVRKYPVRSLSDGAPTTEQVCYAVDFACIWYWKEVLCLQRSAATTCLLRANGVHAQLVIGAQPLPFRAHAWVEVNGHVVNDKPYTSEIYGVLDRC